MGSDPITAAINAVGNIWSSANGKRSAKYNRDAARAMASGQKVAAVEGTKQAREGTKQTEFHWWMNTDNNLSVTLNNLLGVKSSKDQNQNMVPLFIMAFVFIAIILMIVTKKGK